MRELFSCVFATILVLALGAPAFADQIHVDLDCIPLPIADQPADRDPVAQIHAQLDAEQGHFKLNVLHTTLSGRQFWRMNQYTNVGLRHAGTIGNWSDLWQWVGTLTRHPNVLMVGNVGEANGKFFYQEFVVNRRTQADEMVVNAKCTIAG